MGARVADKPSTMLAVTLALLLAALGLLSGDSMIYPWGTALGVVVIPCAALVGTFLLLARAHRSALLFAAAALGAIWQLAAPRIDEHQVLARTGPEAIDLGRHFVVGYDDLPTIQQLVRRGLVGGIFLTRRNVAGRTIEAVGAEVAALQGLRREAGLPPLIVAADQEGGPVSHLSPPLPPPPALSTVTRLPAAEQSNAARRLGLDVGFQLRRIGVTMDFAPVCDLMPEGAPSVLDWDTRLATRSISADPTVTALVASSFSQGLLDAGITPTAKHFPGLGRVARDTHLFGASLVTKTTVLQGSDWVPFRRVASLAGAAIMLSHVALEAIDTGVPVSSSRRVVAGLLRQQWQFGGITVTDDLTMGAIEHSGLCRAVERALNAGVDVLLVSWDTTKVYPVLRCALAALDAGRLDPAVLKQSGRRLEQLEFSHPWGQSLIEAR
jgi:beta-N-acetylhexosaminidase